jgi:hypothetical protein
MKNTTALHLKYILCFFLLFVTNIVYAHTINYALEKAPVANVFWYYLKLGYMHILPDGFDHILFVTGLCLLNNKISTILWQATAFTVAHSITLALSMKNIIIAPSAVVEPIIALSILFVAVENLLIAKLSAWRILLVFGFGLVHGLGFASSLNEIGLPGDKFFLSIFSFNVGVEFGQMTVILLVFALIIYPFHTVKNYKKAVVYPLSIIIALIASYWTIERVFFL